MSARHSPSKRETIKIMENKKQELTKQDAENLLDALEEWNDAEGPKELEDNEVGLNEMRYHKLANNIKKMLEE